MTVYGCRLAALFMFLFFAVVLVTGLWGAPISVSFGLGMVIAGSVDLVLVLFGSGQKPREGKG